MKKLWYLFLSLILAFGIAACEKGGDDVEPQPDPEPVGPTEAPKGVVTDITYKRDGYQAVEVSWNDPDEEFPITSYTITATPESKDAEALTFSFDAADVELVNGKQTYTIEGLEQPKYNLNILVANECAQQKNGAKCENVEPFTLVSMTMPTVAIVEQSGNMYLRFSNLNGTRNIFDHISVVMKDGSDSVIFEGEAEATDQELGAALDNKQANTNPVDIMIELAEGTVLDAGDSYSVDYTIYAHPALGGTLEEGVIKYEEVLDMLDEPASIEGSADGLGVGVEVQPLFFHFYSYGSSYMQSLNTAVITVPQIYEDNGDGTKQPRYRTYKIYVGSCEEDSALYVDANGQEGVYTHDDSRWYNVENINPDAISELNPNTEKQQNLYRDIWAGQAIKTIDLVHKQYPSYVRVEAYDAYGRKVAMGHRLTATFSVEATQPDIQAHQPKFELQPNNDGLTYTLKASHLSAARAYAKTVKWSIKDENGEVVAEDIVEGGSYYSDGLSLRHCATLINKDWTIEAKKFVPGQKYTVDYEIEYIPVYTIPNMDAQQPLDYNTETGKFTPTEGGVVENATGMDHDVRILRDYIRDEEGNVLFRTRAKDESGDVIYAFKHESGDYRGWVAWPSSTVTLTSEQMAQAGATLQNEVTAPEDNGQVADYKVNLELVALKRMNAMKISWNAYSAEDITKVIVNDGVKDFEITAGGKYAWQVSDGRASIELDGVSGVEPVITVKVYAGETLLGEAQDMISIFSLDNWEAPEFEWQRQSDGTYKFIVSKMMNINYAFSHINTDNESKRSTIRIYNTKTGSLLYTLMANDITDWWYNDWAAYARWSMSMQDTWSEWQWDGNYKTSEPVKTAPSYLLPAGTYRVEYEIGYVVNKNGFWSTTEMPNTTEVSYRPDPAQYPDACVAFPPRYYDHYVQHENVLYDENKKLEDEPKDEPQAGQRHALKVFTKRGEATFTVGSTSGPQIYLSTAIDDGKEDIYAPLTNSTGKSLNSKNGLYESVNLSWTVENCTYDKAVISYNGESVEVTDGSKSKVITGIKTPSVTFTVALYSGSSKLVSKSISTNVYTLEPAKEQVNFTIKSDADKYYIFVDGGLSGKEWFFHDLSFNVYAKDDTKFENPLFTNNITKNGNGGLNPTIKAWASFGRASYFGVDNSDYDENCTAEYTKYSADAKPTIDGTKLEGYFTGLTAGTDYVIKYTLRAYPQIFDHTSADGLHFFKSILFNDSVLSNTIEGTVEVSTPAE